jgi:pentatricopeptide repeat protein
VGIAISVDAYNELLNVLAKSRRPETAEAFLDEWMQTLNEPRKYNKKAHLGRTRIAARPPRPNTNSYNIVLHSLSRSLTIQDHSSRTNGNSDTGSKIHKLTTENLKYGNLVVYERILKLFRAMDARDKVTYTTIISFLCRQQNVLQWSGRRVRDEVQGCLGIAWQDSKIKLDAAFITNILYSLAQVRGDAYIPLFAEDITLEYMAPCGTHWI